MKTWKETNVFTGREIEEDAPMNSVAGGGVSMPPDAVHAKKKKKEIMSREDDKIDRRSKTYRTHRAKLEAARLKRQERKNQSKGKFIEAIQNHVKEQSYVSNPPYDTMHGVVALNAAKSSTGYELYHKEFSGAMQHAYKFAKSKGYTVDPKEIDDKVSTGPSKPSKGKTNSYTLGTNKKQKVQIQVTNLDNKRYELNMYIN